MRPNDDQIREAMARCSVFASASEYEAFGIAAIEGLSAGLLPLLSDIGSFSDIVERTKVGVIANFDHPEKAVEAFLAAWTAWTETTKNPSKVPSTPPVRSIGNSQWIASMPFTSEPPDIRSKGFSASTSA